MRRVAHSDWEFEPCTTRIPLGILSRSEERLAPKRLKRRILIGMGMRCAPSLKRANWQRGKVKSGNAPSPRFLPSSFYQFCFFCVIRIPRVAQQLRKGSGQKSRRRAHWKRSKHQQQRTNWPPSSSRERHEAKITHSANAFFFSYFHCCAGRAFIVPAAARSSCSLSFSSLSRPPSSSTPDS